MNSKERRDAFVQFACAYAVASLAKTPVPEDLEDKSIAFAKKMLKKLDTTEDKGGFQG